MTICAEGRIDFKFSDNGPPSIDIIRVPLLMKGDVRKVVERPCAISGKMQNETLKYFFD